MSKIIKAVIALSALALVAACGGGGGINLTGGGNDTDPIKSDLTVANLLNYSLEAVSMLSLPSN